MKLPNLPAMFIFSCCFRYVGLDLYIHFFANYSVNLARCLLPLRFCPFWVSHGMILQVRFEVNVPRTFSDGLKKTQLTGDSPRVVSWGGGILRAFGGKMSPAIFETGGFVFQRYFFSSKMGHFGHLNRWVLFKWCHSSGRLGGFKSYFPLSQRNDPIRIMFFKHPSKTLDPGPGRLKAGWRMKGDAKTVQRGRYEWHEQNNSLGGGNSKSFGIFIPNTWGFMVQIWRFAYFSKGLKFNHQRALTYPIQSPARTWVDDFRDFPRRDMLL